MRRCSKAAGGQARRVGSGRARSETRRGEARRGEARRGEARRGEARRGEARRGEARRGGRVESDQVKEVEEVEEVGAEVGSGEGLGRRRSSKTRSALCPLKPQAAGACVSTNRSNAARTAATSVAIERRSSSARSGPSMRQPVPLPPRLGSSSNSSARIRGATHRSFPRPPRTPRSRSRRARAPRARGARSRRRRRARRARTGRRGPRRCLRRRLCGGTWPQEEERGRGRARKGGRDAPSSWSLCASSCALTRSCSWPMSSGLGGSAGSTRTSACSCACSCGGGAATTGACGVPNRPAKVDARRARKVDRADLAWSGGRGEGAG